jgi:hypothetical protein
MYISVSSFKESVGSLAQSAPKKPYLFLIVVAIVENGEGL